MKSQNLVVKAQEGSHIFQLIPHGQLSGDFPAKFIGDCAHWLDLESGELEFRLLQQAWRRFLDNWHMTFNPLGTGHALMRCRKRTLVDIHSPLFKQVASVLGTLDAPEHIHITESECGTVEVDIVRLHVRFFINDSGALESQEHNATVDQNQDLGCLYGLENKLVLQGAVGQGCRTVLVLPYRRVALEKTWQHTRVTIEPPTGSRVKYFTYTLDTHLQALLDSSGLLASLYLAYLHAVTGFMLLDPATNRSGTDVAPRLLRQARMKSAFPLNAEEVSLLRSIAGLTPRREYYPCHLKVMQTAKWNDHLSEMAQHDDFGSVVQEIINHNTLFSDFYGVIGMKSVESEIRPGNGHLLKRARLRHDQFRGSEFGGRVGNPTVQRGKIRCTRSCHTERSESPCI